MAASCEPLLSIARRLANLVSTNATIWLPGWNKFRVGEWEAPALHGWDQGLMTQSDLAVLAAKQAISESIYRYCRGMDRIDNDLANSAFHPGATVKYGADIFVGSAADFVEMIADTHRTMTITHHQVGNMLIAVDGDVARSETYITVTLHQKQDDGSLAQLRGLGRYLDRWEQREGRWKITDRVYVHSIDEKHPVDDNGFKATATRDRADASYEYLAS